MSIKKSLYEYCESFLKNKIQTLKDDINHLQTSANEETKSSAGDKYETGRAMAQLEIEKSLGQLEEVKKQMDFLSTINPELTSSTITKGSVVFTNNGNFYLSVSLGLVKIEGNAYYCISPASPIAVQFMKQKEGNSFIFNNRHYKIEKVI